MCRSIKPLFNLEPAVAEEEIHEAALQFVRKVSGFTRPSRANEAAFNAAVEAIAATCSTLLTSLETKSTPKDRAEVAARVRARRAKRVSKEVEELSPSPPSMM